MPLFSQPLVFIDTETTGTSPFKHELLEVGAVIVRSQHPFAIVDSFEIKVEPERITDADTVALSVNRFSEEEWRDALPLQIAMQKLAEKIKGASLWGWNVGFDRAFLEPALNRSGITLEEYGIDYTWYDLKIDFRRWAILTGKIEEFAPRFSLSSARRAFGIETDEAHRALADAVSTYQVFLRLEEEFGLLAPNFKRQTLPF